MINLKILKLSMACKKFQEKKYYKSKKNMNDANENIIISFNNNNSITNKRILSKNYLALFNYFILKIFIFLLLKTIILVDDRHYIILKILEPDNSININNESQSEIGLLEYTTDINFTIPSEYMSDIFINNTWENTTVDIIDLILKENNIVLSYDNPLSDFSYMFSDYNNITEIYFYNMFEDVINMTYTFNNCINLRKITFISWNSSELIKSKGMFYNCQSLTSLDLTKFNKISGEDISYMFYNCTSLENIKFNNNTKCLTTNMRGLFQNCISLTSLDISPLSSANVEIVWDMFKGCTNLSSLELSSFDTSSVTDMQSMFEGCASLESLDLSNFNTSKVQYMNKMFYNCINIKSINFKNINSESLGTMYQMFYNCSSLEYLNIYSLIEDVQSIHEMFEGVSDNFTFCIKENENIPNIFQLIKNMNATIRDCSEQCYGDNNKRIEIPDKKLCCRNYEHNGNCVDNCPGRTIPNEETKKCDHLSCRYYNYTQDGCIDEIPERYFLNDTILKTIDKCHEDCKTCRGKENNETTNCLKCNDNSAYFYLGNCLRQCENEGYYDSKEGIFKCKCHKEKCYECSQESLELDSCISCNEGYYPKFNEINLHPGFINCYQNPNGYFFDNVRQIYKQCYPTCGSCFDIGTKEKNLCTSCNSNNGIPAFYDDNSKTFNCYPNCSTYYYFDDKNEYVCLKEAICPKEKSLMVNGTNKCISSCPSNEYKLEYKNICYNECPDGSVIKDEHHCKTYCRIDRPFEIVKQQKCVSSCYIMERFHHECVTRCNEQLDELSDIIMTDIRSDLSETFDYTYIIKNQSVIIEEFNILYEIISTNVSTKNKRISRIILGECETELKKFYDIKDKEPLYIFKADATVEGQTGPVVSYEIYYPLDGIHLSSLDLGVCEGMDIQIIIPTNVSDIDLDLFNKDSSFYNDICYPYTNENGTDMILADRKKEFEQKNRSLCEEGCTLINYNKEDGTVQCSCGVKLNIPFASQIKIDKNKLYEFINLKSIVNFKVMKCVRLLFSVKGIKKNIGFYTLIPIFLMYFVCIIFFYNKDFKLLKYKINEIIFAKRNSKYFIEKPLKPRDKSLFVSFLDKKKINFMRKDKIRGKNIDFISNLEDKENSEKERIQKDQDKTINDLAIQNSSFHTNNNSVKFDKEKIDALSNQNENEQSILSIKKNKRKLNLNRPNVSSLFKPSNKVDDNSAIQAKINEEQNKPTLKKKGKNKFNDKQKEKLKKIIDFIDEELNDMGYAKALKYDHRTYIQYYLSLLMSNHILIKIFNNNDYNSRIIKIFLAFLNFASAYAVNALFFSDETMHQISEDGGAFNFIYQLPQIVYSTIISFIIDSSINSLALSQESIISIKHEKVVKIAFQKAKDVIRVLSIKFKFFYIISFLFLLAFWYYLGCFCAVYTNTQFHLIKDTLISFGTGNLYPFAISLIPALFRIYSLSDEKKKRRIMYKFSKLLTMF